MLKASKINLGEHIDIDTFKLEGITYEDKDYSGMIEIEFEGDYERINDDFSHEFGVEKGHHYELKIKTIESVTFEGIFKENTEEQAELEITFTYSNIFEDLKSMLEELTVEEY